MFLRQLQEPHSSMMDTQGVVPTTTVAQVPHSMAIFMSPEGNRKETILIQQNVTENEAEPAEFDPLTKRNVDKPTTNKNTLSHLLRASLGTGVLVMPKAYKCSGLVNGVFFTVLVAFICTHCTNVLVKCAHVLYKKTKKYQMTYPEVGKAALENGPQTLRGWASGFDIFIRITLFTTYFGTCAGYTAIIADNIKQVVDYYTGTPASDIKPFILALLLPLIFLGWIRNLKYLAPVSMVANVCMALGLGIMTYYLIGSGELKFDNFRNMRFKPVQEWPEFFTLSVFAMEAIGVVMPLENVMKTPRALLGFYGLLNRNMTLVTFVYIVLGFLGYLRYGEGVRDNVTLSLNIELIPAQVVKIAIAVAVFCTFGLQFFVCIEIIWESFKKKFIKRSDLANYVIRAFLVTLCVWLGVAVPSIAPFMTIISAFGFSILGIITPALIEIVTFWHIGFGPCKYIVWKNLLICVFGILAIIFGIFEAIINIIN